MSIHGWSVQIRKLQFQVSADGSVALPLLLQNPWAVLAKEFLVFGCISLSLFSCKGTWKISGCRQISIVQIMTGQMFLAWTGTGRNGHLKKASQLSNFKAFAAGLISLIMLNTLPGQMLRAGFSKDCGQAMHEAQYTCGAKNARSAHSMRWTSVQSIAFNTSSIPRENCSYFCSGFGSLDSVLPVTWVSRLNHCCLLQVMLLCCNRTQNEWHSHAEMFKVKKVHLFLDFDIYRILKVTMDWRMKLLLLQPHWSNQQSVNSLFLQKGM